MFKAIVGYWMKNGKIYVPGGAVCDALIIM
jgi:hypothetical protein